MRSCLLVFHSILAISLSTWTTNPEVSSALPQTQSPEDARVHYEAALVTNPNDLQAQSAEVQVSERIALDARAAGNNDLALRTLLRAKNFAPANTRLLYDLGVLEDQMRLFRDADEMLTRAAVLGLMDPNLLYAAGRVKFDLGDLDAAEEKIRAYLVQRPDDPTAHYALGRIYRQGAHFDQASAEFERSIALMPKQTEAYYQLGETQLAREQYNEAMHNFAITLERNPKHAGALVGTGIACYRQKQYAEAETRLRSAVTADPSYQPGHYYLGLTLARTGKKDESSRELVEAARLAAIDIHAAASRLRINSAEESPEPPR